jgi:hypothetical protein
MDWNEIPQDPHHLGVQSGVSKTISELMVCLAQIVHLSCTDTNTISKWTKNEIPLEPRYLGVQSSGSKMISEPTVHSRQTVHLSCVKISTISKQTETSIHLSLIIEEYHWVCPKWFLSLWYAWCKPCTYLTPTLTLSLNGLKRDSKWPKSPRGSIGCVQNDFWAYGTFSSNHSPCLHRH